MANLLVGFCVVVKATVKGSAIVLGYLLQSTILGPSKIYELSKKCDCVYYSNDGPCRHQCGAIFSGLIVAAVFVLSIFAIFTKMPDWLEYGVWGLFVTNLLSLFSEIGKRHRADKPSDNEEIKSENQELTKTTRDAYEREITALKEDLDRTRKGLVITLIITGFLLLCLVFTSRLAMEGDALFTGNKQTQTINIEIEKPTKERPEY
jgi:hypothetical protein